MKTLTDTMQRRSVHLAEDQIAKLEALAKARRTSVAQLIREAIDRLIDDEKQS